MKLGHTSRGGGGGGQGLVPSHLLAAHPPRPSNGKSGEDLRMSAFCGQKISMKLKVAQSSPSSLPHRGGRIPPEQTGPFRQRPDVLGFCFWFASARSYNAKLEAVEEVLVTQSGPAFRTAAKPSQRYSYI